MKGVIERGDGVDEVVRSGTLRMLTARKDRLNRRLERLGGEGMVLDEVVLDGEEEGDGDVGDGDVGDGSIERESAAANATPDMTTPEMVNPDYSIPNNSPENATSEMATPENDTHDKEDAPEELPVERRSLPKEEPVPKRESIPKNPIPRQAISENTIPENATTNNTIPNQPIPPRPSPETTPTKPAPQTPTKPAHQPPTKPAHQPPIPMKTLDAISEGEEEPIEANIPGLPEGMALQPVSEKEATATLKKGHVRDTLKRIVAQYGTMRGETLQAERFRLVVRDKEKEKQWKPSASVIVMEEEETKSKLKMKRMIRRLVEDDQNDERRHVDWVAFRFHDRAGFHAGGNAFARVVRAPECVERLVRWRRGWEVSGRNDR